MKTYIIDQARLESIIRFKQIFQVAVDRINDLCKEERDDIVVGFELGQIHAMLTDCFVLSMEVVSDLEKQ